ncbi:hypothetical protein [Demequina lutea]|uniref:Branched-subunit amino acid transport protein n=1 Tax=Demequina lutea TaxID=431489 RepID=A0A7Z0CJM2_9MICO|nr:hypothetical protein [Demequina lutea]NYI40890.1 branched-subunit amino acid transport protein [Demequina lutea]
MNRDKRSTLKPNLAVFVPLATLPALVMAALHGEHESRWSDPSTWWGVVTGILLALAVLGARLMVGRRNRDQS